MMFRRKKPIVCPLGTYQRWLRAQRPDFLWFLRQEELVQEALATEGDDYVQVCVEMGAAEVEEREKESQDEEDAVRQLSAAMVRKRLGDAPASTEPLSMGGLGQRRVARDAEVAAEKRVAAKDQRFMGRAPDQVVTDVPEQDAIGPVAEARTP